MSLISSEDTFNTSTFIKMAIVHVKFPEYPLSIDEANLIKEYILATLATGFQREHHPHFNSCVYSAEGILIVTFPEAKTLTWLEAVVKLNNGPDVQAVEYSYSDEYGYSLYNQLGSRIKQKQKSIEYSGGAKRLSFKIKIVEFKNVPQYSIKVCIEIPGPEHEDPKNVLTKLKIQNFGLHTNTWRIWDDDNKQTIIFLVDEQTRKWLIENDFKLYLNFSRVTCRIVGKVKRDAITGQLKDVDKDATAGS